MLHRVGFVFGWFCGAYLTIGKGLMQVLFELTPSRASSLPQLIGGVTKIADTPKSTVGASLLAMGSFRMLKKSGLEVIPDVHIQLILPLIRPASPQTLGIAATPNVRIILAK